VISVCQIFEFMFYVFHPLSTTCSERLVVLPTNALFCMTDLYSANCLAYYDFGLFSYDFKLSLWDCFVYPSEDYSWDFYSTYVRDQSCLVVLWIHVLLALLHPGILLTPFPNREQFTLLFLRFRSVFISIS